MFALSFTRLLAHEKVQFNIKEWDLHTFDILQYTQFRNNISGLAREI